MKTDMTAFRDFILGHAEDDTAALLLAREKWPDIDMSLAVNTIESRRKLKAKLPAWYGCPDLIYPNTISAEQCSSSETAALKASVAASLAAHDKMAAEEKPAFRGHIADLTGGLGADSCAFREAGFKVLYNEMDEALCNAARHNVSGIIGEFAPDIIYLDPARRDGAGRKVFLMEDCRPDILALKDELLGCAQYVMVKLSPMADIDMAVSRLGERCREIHVIAAKGECRELLAVLDRDWKGEPGFIAWESPCNPFVFTAQEKRQAAMRLAAGPERLSGFLFEPGKALLKAGAFNLLGERFGLVKLAKSTHLYLLPGNNGKDTIEKLLGFGKVFRIIRTLPLGKAGIKEAWMTWPQADVTARNIPMTSDMLRTRLRKKPAISGNGTGIIHIFGTRCEFSAGKADNLLIVTERITRLSDI